jgi:hypothetical protein
MQALLAAAAFPERGPYRVDQVRSDPLLLMGLFAVQIALAWLIDRSARRQHPATQSIASLLLVLVTGLFFTLASWGLGDVTRLSYMLVDDPQTLGWSEPLWTLLAPLVRWLPYRFSFLHGAVAAGYAAAALWLARRQKCDSWGGWWALLVVCSPLLRNFLQSGVTRQALSTLLLMPLMLWCAGGPRLPRLWLMALTGSAAFSHSSFPLSLLVAGSPLVLRAPAVIRRVRPFLDPRRAGSARLMLVIGVPMLMALAWLAWSGQAVREKLFDYLWNQDYFPTFLLRLEVDQLLLAIAISGLAAIWLARSSRKQLLESPLARASGLFIFAIFMLRLSIRHSFFPQITSRFQDAVGFYLLIIFLSWLSTYSLQRLSVVPLVATLSYWLFDRLAFSGLIPCGRNDEFLCIPDRLPWQVTYWN